MMIRRCCAFVVLIWMLEAAEASAQCSYSVTQTTFSTVSTSSVQATSVITGTQCSWTATSTVPWITITNGGSHTGMGSVSFQVAANPTASVRTGTLIVAGHTITVTQQASSCVYTVTPTMGAPVTFKALADAEHHHRHPVFMERNDHRDLDHHHEPRIGIRHERGDLQRDGERRPDAHWDADRGRSGGDRHPGRRFRYSAGRSAQPAHHLPIVSRPAPSRSPSREPWSPAHSATTRAPESWICRRRARSTRRDASGCDSGFRPGPTKSCCPPN